MAYSDDVRGIGGWLAFLIVILCFLSPIGTILTNLTEISAMESENLPIVAMPEWQTIKTVAWIFAFAQAAILAFTGWLLYTKHVAKTPFYAIAGLWIGSPLISLLSIVAVSYIVGEALISPDSIGPLIRTIIFAMIWTTYLLMSKRVKNTYYDGDPYAQYLEEEEG